MLHSIIADTHTHTVFSGHAYSTLEENCRRAAEIGLPFLACTDHTERIPDAPGSLYFSNLRNLPPVIHGVYLLRGCEVNICGRDGALDLADRFLKNLDLVIASMHTIVYRPETIEAHTQAWLRVAENPLVDVIGHCGDGRFPFDYETVIPVFGEKGKIVEINAHSLSARPGSEENCKKIALLCKEHRVPVVVSSDAHISMEIGQFDPALQLLSSINFPEELVLNGAFDRFAAVMEKKTGRAFPSIG